MEEWSRVGPRIFFSDSSALLLQPRDAFECQQLAEAQKGEDKDKAGSEEEGRDCI